MRMLEVPLFHGTTHVNKQTLQITAFKIDINDWVSDL